MGAEEKIIIKRLFKNPNGDWKKLEKKVDEIQIMADVVQGLAEDLVKAEAKLRVLTLDAYHLAPKTDCLFYDSPVSPDKQVLSLKMYLKKLGWAGVRDVWVDAITITPYAETVKEGCRWLLKFKNEKE